MKIHIYEVEDSLVLEYCRVITQLEKGFVSELEYMRKEIHEKILESVGVCPSGYRRDDRLFMIELSRTVCDLTYIN